MTTPNHSGRTLKSLSDIFNLKPNDAEAITSKIGFDIQDVANSLNCCIGDVDPLVLSSIAHYFQTSSKNIIDFANGATSKIITNDHFVFTKSNHFDNFWGHLGIKLPKEEKSHWFPITTDTVNHITESCYSLNNNDSWVLINTLNNRSIAIRPSRVSLIHLVDDASDAPLNDWDIPIDGYTGLDGELYKFLNDYYLDDFPEEDLKFPEYVIKQIDLFTEKYDLGYQEVYDLLYKTVIITDDGIEDFHIEQEDIEEIWSDIKYDCLTKILHLRLSDENDVLIPSSKLIMLNIPRNLLGHPYQDQLVLDFGENI